MHKFSVVKILPYTVEQMYKLILDIEKYPQFLPWCSRGEVIECDDDVVVADLTINFKAFSESYRSKIALSPTSPEYAAVDVEMIEGPFKYLSNLWRLKRVDSGVEVEFYVDFAFKSTLLDKVIGLIFESACKKMVESFEQRARELYGDQ